MNSKAATLSQASGWSWEYLRRRTIGLLSLALLGFGFVTTWLAPPDPLMLRGRFLVFASLLVQGILGCALHRRMPSLARVLLLIGPTLSVGYASHISDSCIVPCFATLVVLGNATISTRQGAIAALLSTAMLLVARSVDGILLQAILLLWMVAAIQWISSDAFFTALGWYWDSRQRYNVVLAQLRDRQGELNRTLAALTEATRRLERTNRELDLALQEAEEARDIKWRFAANISHELRTPLNIIIGFSEMLCTSPETYGDLTWPPALRNDLLTIWRNADHLLRMVDDVLDLAQIEAARLPVLPEPTDLSELIRDTLVTAAPLVRGANLELRANLPDGTLILDVDRTRIRQVLLNLISNAVRHTTQGFVEVGISEGEDDVTVYVRDSGEGIPSHMLETIFQEFEQVLPPSRPAYEGTGLGLAISRHFVNLHGGRIWATSEVGVGSTFCFDLPRLREGHRARMTQLQRTRHGPVRRSQEKRDLVVLCHDSAALRLLDRHLESLRVLQAVDTQAAAALVDEHHPEAVLIAAEAPDRVEQALAEARSIRAAIAPFDVPIVACSVPTERHAGLALGVDDFLIKPVTRPDLEAAVTRICTAPQRLLVVDDQPDMLRLLVRMGEQIWPEAEIRAAGSGNRAIELLDWHPDVVLLDLLMPDVSGLDVLRALRARADMGETRVIAVTARGPAESLAAIPESEVHVVKNGGFSSGEVVHFAELLAKAMPPHYASS